MFKKQNNQPLLDEHILYQNLPKDLLYKLNQLIDWKPFEKILSKLHSSSVGRPAYNPLIMLKILIIQQIYGHSDPEIEIMLKGNLFYRRFVGLSATDPVPDHSTISRFRSALSSMNIYQECFEELNRQLAEKGKQTVYGYKDHIAIDAKHEFITKFSCTPANVHDSKVVDELVDEEDKAIFADKAYDSRGLKRWCRDKGIYYGVLAKGARHLKISSSQKKRNKKLSAVRRKVENVFGILSLHLSRAKARYVGLVANEIHLFLTVFTYNILRLFWHMRRKESMALVS